VQLEIPRREIGKKSLGVKRRGGGVPEWVKSSNQEELILGKGKILSRWEGMGAWF